jgi:hypothetical protein
VLDAKNLTPNPFPSGKGNRIVGSNLFPSGNRDRTRRLTSKEREGKLDSF